MTQTYSSDYSCDVAWYLFDAITVHPSAITGDYDPLLRTIVDAGGITRFRPGCMNIDFRGIYKCLLFEVLVLKILDVYPSRHAGEGCFNALKPN